MRADLQSYIWSKTISRLQMNIQAECTQVFNKYVLKFIKNLLNSIKWQIFNTFFCTKLYVCTFCYNCKLMCFNISKYALHFYIYYKLYFIHSETFEEQTSSDMPRLIVCRKEDRCCEISKRAFAQRTSNGRSETRSFKSVALSLSLLRSVFVSRD